MSRIVNRAQIVEFRRSKLTAVAVPEWGGDVLVRPLSAGEVQGMADVFAAGDRDLATNIEAALRIVANGSVTEDGEQLFASIDDLRELEVGPIVRLASEIAKVSGISGDDSAGK